MIERLKVILRPLRLYRWAAFGWHWLRDPVFRRDYLLQRRHPPGLFQPYSQTAPERYPKIFRFVRGRLAEQPDLRLLSFGCSSGEEVFSLRRHFPQAAIKGVDINPANIALCFARHVREGRDPRMTFECRNSAADEPCGSYDAVFCMAVFQHGRLRADRAIVSCEPHLRFADFAQTVAGLAACVKPGGYLVVRHAMFRFADTEYARDFRPVLSLPVPPQLSPRFDTQNRRLPDAAGEDVVFQKNHCAGGRA